LTGFDEVGHEQPVLIANHGSERHHEFEILTVAAVSELALGVFSVAGPPMGLAIVSQERPDTRIGDEDDIAAPSPVASVGPSARFALPFQERGSACTARATACE
jgi:hypothetical protein